MESPRKPKNQHVCVCVVCAFFLVHIPNTVG